MKRGSLTHPQHNPASPRAPWLGLSRGLSSILTAAFCLAGVLAPVHDVAAQAKPLQGQTIVVYTFGGTQLEVTKELVFKPFEAETGAKIVIDDSCCTRMPAVLEAGQFLGDVVLGLDRGGMLARADKGYLVADPRLEKIARARGVPEPFPSPSMMITNSYSYVIAAKDKTVPLPKTWAEFWDAKKFPGSRGLLRVGPQVQMEAALLADGVPADKLYPLDVTRALKKLDALRASSKIVVNTSGADMINNLGTGEATYSFAYSNRAFMAQKNGINLNYGFDDGFIVGNGGAILKGAKNVDGAVALLEYNMRPEVLARFAERTGMAPSYPAATAMVDEKIRPMLPTAPANAAKQQMLNDGFWQANQIELNKRWVGWLAQ